jgi:hypothetical protein
MRRGLLIFLFAGSGVVAASEPVPVPPVAQMDTVVVSGEQPGPGLWKVSKGDHVLWVLGTLAPLPKDISWKSKEVAAVIASAQEVLTAPEVAVTAKVGFFGQLALLPSLIGLRKNPDGTTLKEVVPADLYARWSVLKEKYIGRSGKVETWRPIFAALDLYEAAIRKNGLTDSGLVQKTVKEAARHAGVKLTSPKVELAIEDPKTALKEFKKDPLDDLECFRKTLDRIDTDLAAMTARANAWATADLDALRSLPYTDQMAACRAAITDSNLARTRGAGDIDARVEQTWVAAATRALASNQVTFAMLPIARLLSSDGYLWRLQAQGYVVVAPDSAQEDAADLGPGVSAR